ncbi:phenylacetate--CoA ligase family protein [Amycolatopsis sp. SID8362]|uniref:phenylacetate--CoA ligase family protein n=1 Tax=Amycolatopsis sp. SID8362 TaxID=2690346 RepID=UPI001369F0B3|nr:phenylacetate--CoA ligase family protein [Amycolatopsis sp. SID8362]NBH03507.1 phenylacetate--CoA ligase family protein [Amycolatopsis sp. SID8362]NED40207.1 phenylacetate--CoA ligase family protein [Amycolatopsis sp. SID8362]
MSLSELVAFARTYSPYYAWHYAGLPARITSVEQLPMLDHTAFWNSDRVVGNQLLTGPQIDGIVIKTGGTTSTPRISCYSDAEWRTMCATFGRGLVAAGLCAGDRVANLFYGGELYSSFIFTLNTLQVADLPTVQLPIVGNAAPESAVRTILDCAATVVAGPPTTLCRLARYVLDTHGPIRGIRVILVSGEACHVDQHILLNGAFPEAEVRSLGYASVDAGILAAPVEGTDIRLHRVFTDSKLVEILDPVTYVPIEEPGVPGRVVVTDLVRRLMPILRYPVGDVAEWEDFDSRTLRLRGRSVEAARFGPVSLYLHDLRGIVSTVDVAAEIEGLQVMLCRHDGKDQLVLRLAGVVEAPELFAELVVERILDAQPRIADAVEDGVVHPITVQWTEHAELCNPRTGKLVRLRGERAA